MYVIKIYEVWHIYSLVLFRWLYVDLSAERAIMWTSDVKDLPGCSKNVSHYAKRAFCLTGSNLWHVKPCEA